MDTSKINELIIELTSMIIDENNKNRKLQISGLDYVYKNEKDVGNRVKIFKHTTRYNYAESFLERINENISNIHNTDILHPKNGYQFPSTATSKKYHELFKIHESESFINESKDSTLIGLKSLRNNLNNNFGEAKNYSITGKVGSGKSTFIKYIRKLLEDGFDDYNIIYSAIRYEDCKEKVRHETTKEHWKEYFEKIILDQLVYHGLARIKDDESSIFSKLRTYSDVQLRLSKDEELKQQIAIICDILHEGLLLSSWTQSLVTDLNIETKKLLLNFISANYHYRFLMIFDGFDAFSIDKMIHRNTESIIDYFFDVIFNKGDILSLKKETYSCLISLRDCTYAKLLRKLYTEENWQTNIENWKICPPGVKRALHRGIYSYFEKEKLPNNLCDKFIKTIDKIHDRIKTSFKTDDDEVVKIFNQDYRRLKSYYILIIKQVISDIVDEKGEFNHVENFLDYILQLPIDKILQEHNLVELLLLNESKVFYNYFSSINIEADNPDDEIPFHAEPNPGKGLVDNLFGYSLENFKTYADIPLTLVKTRILQFLNSKEEHSTIDEIKEMLSMLGYNIPPEMVGNFLHILGESGFIKNRWAYNKSIIVYKETSLGEYAITELLNNGRYYEHVIQKTLLPNNIVTLMMSSCKYCDEDIKGKANWIYASTINLCMFANYILFLEEYELNKVNKYTEKDYNTYFSLREYLLEILTDLSAVFKSPIGRYININDLTSEIRFRKKRFILHSIK